MADKYVTPEFGSDAFHCPNCGVYAHQEFVGTMRPRGGERQFSGALTELADYHVCVCDHCLTPSIWFERRLVHPNLGGTPVPHEDMPEEVLVDYQEARSVADASPRSAAALLRLALQKLCIHLGEPGENLNRDIGSLVQKGLDSRVQKALDILRITGNNAVHPGELRVDDDLDLVLKLFTLLNTVVEATITQPRELDALWDGMPERARRAAEQRAPNADG